MTILRTANMFYEYDQTDVKSCLFLRTREEGFDELTTILMDPIQVQKDKSVELAQHESEFCKKTVFIQSRVGSKSILVPINVSCTHWVGLAIKLNRNHVVRKIYYIDPLGNVQIENELLRRISRSFGVVCGQNTPIVRLTLLRQTDTTSSGAVIVENLIRVVKKQFVSKLADESATKKIRNRHIRLMGELFGRKQEDVLNEWNFRKHYLFSWNMQLYERRIYRFPPSKLISLFTEFSPPHIILLGKSGAGKGTLSKMLADRYGYTHLSIGDIHRDEDRRGTKIGLVIRNLVAQNRVASPEMAQITYGILNRKLHNIITKNKLFILDNFPTCPLHVPYIFKIISKYRLKDKTILLVPEISDSESISRLEHRRVCSSSWCGKSYNLVTLPPKNEGRCDTCNSRLILRMDDTAEIIKNKRLPFYRENILPAIRLLAQKMDFYPVQEVFGLLRKYLGIFPNEQMI